MSKPGPKELERRALRENSSTRLVSKAQRAQQTPKEPDGLEAILPPRKRGRPPSAPSPEVLDTIASEPSIVPTAVSWYLKHRAKSRVGMKKLRKKRREAK